MPLPYRCCRLAGALAALVVLPLTQGHARAQDFIDVEAERERAAEVISGPRTTTPYAVGAAQPATGAALSEPPPIGNNVGGLFNQVQRLQQEVMRLNGVVEQLTYELNLLKQQSLDRYADIDRRLAGGAAVAPGDLPATGDTGTPEAGSGGVSTAITPPPSAVAEQAGEGEAYRAAYALVRGQEFDAAVTAFDSFLRRFPDGRYAPNAHYWLGELYLVLDPPDPEASRQAFMLLLDQYPTNSKVPDALYKLGRVHFIKGNNVRAREFLNRVMREYPNSTAARLASDFLDQNL